MCGVTEAYKPVELKVRVRVPAYALFLEKLIYISCFNYIYITNALQFSVGECGHGIDFPNINILENITYTLLVYYKT